MSTPRGWSRALSGRLAHELSGHAAVGHLRMREVVQGSDLVLEGVEEGEAPALGGCLERAVAATNATADPAAPRSANMLQEAADSIAVQVGPAPLQTG